jgi:FMN reductase
MQRRPFIVGLGGTQRAGSSSERALAISLAAAAADGADTLIIPGSELDMPIYNPSDRRRTNAARRFVGALRRCDGIIVASPAYHGTISGLIKNALDYAEDTRDDPRVYFDGIPVGCIACAAGGQAAVHTLASLRAIVHALRGWPTPLGVTLNSSEDLFDASGSCVDPKTKLQLDIVGHQVFDFSTRFVMTSGPTGQPSLAVD